MGILDKPFKPEHPMVIKLRETLVQTYDNLGMAMAKTEESGLLPGSFQQGQDMRETWGKMLRVMANQGNLRKLVENARDDPAISAFRKDFEEVLARDADPIGHVVARRIIANDVLLLDRLNLRRQLAKLAQDFNPVRVVLVRGESGSGKTHGRHLFNRIAREQGANMAYIYGGSVATVNEVIVELFSELLAMNEIPQTFTTDAAGYKLVINKLKEIALRENRYLWIAVDDLSDSSMDSQIRDFFNKFSAMIMTPQLGERFRLMLIDYPEEIPTEWADEIWCEDRTSQADIQQEHVVELLMEWAAGKGLALNEEQTKDRATKIIAGGDVNSKRLKTIHSILKDTIEQMEGAA